MRHTLIWLTLSVLAFASGATQADEPTEISIGSEVLLADANRLGFNLGYDTFYSAAALTKVRDSHNFEGTMYRQITFGPEVHDGKSFLAWYPPQQGWKEIYEGATFKMVSGPSKGQTGTITAVEMEQWTQPNSGREYSLPRFVFDGPITPGGSINEGMMIERDLTHVGQFREADGYWASDNNTLVTGDTDPASFGVAALQMDGSSKPAHFRLGTHKLIHGDLAGEWVVRLRAKVVKGTPKLSVSVDNAQSSGATIQPEKQWRVYEIPFEVTVSENATEDPDNAAAMLVKLETSGGILAVDDVEVWQRGDTNPTAFRDDVVDSLKAFRPGILRKLQMGGSTIENTINPPLRSFQFMSGAHAADISGYGNRATHSKYGLHQFYELCAHIGAEPWYCLPGVMHPDEVAFFMEYLSGDESTAGGKLRVELGQQQPWTEVFKRVHIEFGNEAWNSAAHYRTGGFNGPDYWQELIAAGKSSPHYSSSIVFHAGSQGAVPRRTERIAGDTPNADAISIAPYIMHSLDRDELEAFGGRDGFFRHALALPIWRSTDPQGTLMRQQKAAGDTPLSIYEMNHHLSHGDAPLQPRNELVDSITGGVNVLNAMLMHMKNQGIRDQCFFTAAGEMRMRGVEGNLHLWGAVLTFRDDLKRYRPTFYALLMANQVIAGEMIATKHSDGEPTNTARGFDRDNPDQPFSYPILHSYAFRDGKTRGLILINLDLEQNRPVRITNPDADGQAERWLLAADSPIANNEFENAEPQVTPVADRVVLDDVLELPPHSITVLRWSSR